MENEQKRENLISLIKKFNSTCSKCGKLFLGALLEGSTEVGAYPVYVGISSYPLSCGKCPNCAQECYNDLEKYLEQYNKAPCLDYEEEGLDKGEILAELDCWVYLEENFQWDQLGAGNPNVEGGELIDLYELFEIGISNAVIAQEYDKKIKLIESLEEVNTHESAKSLIELAKDNDSKVRLRAIEALSKIKDSKANKELLILLNNKEVEIKFKSIEGLGNKNDLKIIKKVYVLLSSENNRIREKVVESLGKNDNVKVINYLIEKLNSQDNEVWSNALKIFSKKGENELLIEKLSVIRNIIFEKFSLFSPLQIKQFAYILNWDKPNSIIYLTGKIEIESPENRLKLLDLIQELEIVSSEITFRGAQIPEFEAKVLQNLEQSVYTSNFQLVNEIKSERYKLNIKNIYLQQGFFRPFNVPESAFTVENNRVVKIRCSSHRVIEIPETIEKLRYLKLLDIRRNNPSYSHNFNATTLPELLGNLKSLKILNLVGMELKALPESFGNLTSLEFLNLAYNRLTTLPESIGNLKFLKTLNLENNQFETFPEPIIKLPSLIILCFYNNKLTILPDSIGNLNSLEVLHLETSKLKSLPDSIGNLKSLETLVLRYNRITTLPESILNLESLKTLDLYNNPLDEKSKRLLEFLKKKIKME